MPSNNQLQRTALRTGAEPECWAHEKRTMNKGSSIIWCAIVVWAAISVCTPTLAQERPESDMSSPIVGQAHPVSGPETTFERFMDAMRRSDWAACSRIMHPEALAEFHAIFSAMSQADESGEEARMFLGVEKPEEAATLSPKATFERVMQGIIAINPGMKQIFTTVKAAILGSVPEDDVIHAVHRMSIEVEGTTISKVAVAPFKRDSDELRALFTADMQGMTQAIQRQIGG